MGFFSTLVYLIISFFTGGVLILASLHYMSSVYFENLLIFIYSDPKIRIITGLIGLWIIIRCISAIQSSIAKNIREKTIAFEGNSGEVSISLTALEDMIKKNLSEFSELKEVKPFVTASKKGLQVIMRVVLTSYTNIPEFTERIQSLIRERLQSMLGIEEEIRIKVEIRKIVYPEEKKQKPKAEGKEQPAVPYRDIHE